MVGHLIPQNSALSSKTLANKESAIKRKNVSSKNSQIQNPLFFISPPLGIRHRRAYMFSRLQASPILLVCYPKNPCLVLLMGGIDDNDLHLL